MPKKLLTFFFVLATLCAWGQDEQQRKLEQRKAQIQKEIREFQSLLNQEKKKEKNVLGEIYEKNAKIKLSEKLINTTAKQTRLLSDDIYLNQLEINKLNRELKILKEDYANMLVKAYKNRNEQSRIMFILSSESFLQAYKRTQYMKQYASFRKIQGDEIRAKVKRLDSLDRVMNGQKKVKQQLLTESEKEKQALEKEKEEQEKLVQQIQKDKKKYAADIRKMQQEARDIDRKIDRLIREAIAAANKKTAAAGTAAKKETAEASTSVNKIVLTKEGALVASNFKANRGRLPWPVEKGYISTHFGKHRHPVYKDIEQDSKGIEITTEAGAPVRAVFSGEVMSIQLIAGQRVVYIQHGDYLSLYMNLASINVKTGDKVSTKENIGTVAMSPATGKAVLKFFIFQNTTNLNPESWIAQ
ncbi:peptidoglycan DD-metalloendopeptidase family protein [Flavobacterium sp. J372]|uniref:murein hydrolase activator EnvC family protein n=1 Tax=Flavobacterium sp. J372 TaxID=2898436 RepID=UPI00215087B8|nr:peptidoglycan DD-metalloendopeptidase family protein [Flavobacterium sp. J372]MCR5861211.1 peptidoglycan DD-metalloendopeptidase family protein [Flavobacterium sp. J372]